MKTDKGLADDLDAQERLENRGYQRKTCPNCDGVGRLGRLMFVPCPYCEGRGYTWQAPMER